MEENQEVETPQIDPEYFRNPKRNEGEDYETYKSRRRIVNKMERSRLKGIWFWRSKNLSDANNTWGTYSKKRAKEIMDNFKKLEEQKNVTDSSGE